MAQASQFAEARSSNSTASTMGTFAAIGSSKSSFVESPPSRESQTSAMVCATVFFGFSEGTFFFVSVVARSLRISRHCCATSARSFFSLAALRISRTDCVLADDGASFLTRRGVTSRCAPFIVDLTKSADFVVLIEPSFACSRNTRSRGVSSTSASFSDLMRSSAISFSRYQA